MGSWSNDAFGAGLVLDTLDWSRGLVGTPPPTMTGIRAKSSAGKTPTAGVVSIRGDRLLEFSSTSSRQVRNFPLCDSGNLLLD